MLIVILVIILRFPECGCLFNLSNHVITFGFEDSDQFLSGLFLCFTAVKYC